MSVPENLVLLTWGQTSPLDVTCGHMPRRPVNSPNWGRVTCNIWNVCLGLALPQFLQPWKFFSSEYLWRCLQFLRNEHVDHAEGQTPGNWLISFTFSAAQWGKALSLGDKDLPGSGNLEVAGWQLSHVALLQINIWFILESWWGPQHRLLTETETTTMVYVSSLWCSPQSRKDKNWQLQHREMKAVVIPDTNTTVAKKCKS